MVVEAVWSELVSTGFPVQQGKNREISCVRLGFRPHAPSNRLLQLPFLAQFPSNRNREFSDRNREDLGGNREFEVPL